MRQQFVLLLASISLWMSGPAAGASVAVRSYDIHHAVISGFGGWAHAYDGSITFVRNFTNGPGGPAGTVANYANGSGTLNDGIIGTRTFDTELFVQGVPDGIAIAPAITLRLEKSVKVQSIRIWGGNIIGNFFPGQITGVTVEIGGQALDVTTIPSGDISSVGVPFDDIVDLTGTPLASLVSDTIVLRNFAFPSFMFNQFSITEITVEGTVPPTVTEVAIDVKPGNAGNQINLWAGPKVKVAILSSSTFNALSIDPASITFGHAGDEASLIRCKTPEDVDGDGRLDLVCEFSVAATALRAGDRSAVLKARTTTGVSIIGTDSVDIRTQPAAGEIDDPSQL